MVSASINGTQKRLIKPSERPNDRNKTVDIFQKGKGHEKAALPNPIVRVLWVQTLNFNTIPQHVTNVDLGNWLLRHREGSDKRNNLIVNRAYRALASRGTQPYAVPFKNTPQRRACLPSAQSGKPQNMPAPMWASKCGAESTVVKSDHSKWQT